MGGNPTWVPTGVRDRCGGKIGEEKNPSMLKLQTLHVEAPNPQKIGMNTNSVLTISPIPSMYGIFTYIYYKNQPNAGK